MGKHAKTLLLVETARAILEEHHPMTVRQVYYQLVSSHRKQPWAVSSGFQRPGRCTQERRDPVGLGRRSVAPAQGSKHVG